MDAAALLRTFRAVMVRPEAAIRAVTRRRAEWAAFWLAGVGGIVEAIGNFQELDSQLGLDAYVALVLLVGLVAGQLHMYVIGAVVAHAGRWLGGTARSRDVRAVYAWSNVPLIPVVGVWLVAVAVTQAVPSAEQIPALSAGEVVVVLLFLLIQAVLYIWSLVIFVRGVAAVHRFSRWNAIGAVLLPYALIGGLVALAFLL